MIMIGDYMEMLELWINVLLPILSIAIPVFATVYTVNNRIKNENKEEHKPYLILRDVNDLEKIDEYNYYLNLVSDGKEELNVELILDNCGYGVASNIKFYNLIDGEEIKGDQKTTKEQNQKLFTTFDIAANKEKKIQAKIKGSKENTILCVYKDLNNNKYNFIITINLKENGHYDFYAYQPTSASYKRTIKQNQKSNKTIMKKYGKL